MNQSLTADLTDVLTAVDQAGLWKSLCNISRRPDPETNAGPLGQVATSVYVAVAGLQNIQCMKSPLVEQRPDITDAVKQPDMSRERLKFHVLLRGYFPAVQQFDKATVDGVAYEVFSAEPDSQHIMTRLAVRTYSV